MQLIGSIGVVVMLYYGVAFGQPLKGGIPATLPTLQVNEQGQLTGRYGDVALVECVTKQLQQDIHWKSYPTARLIQEVKDNNIDIIFPMGFTLQRRKHLVQSEPIEVIDDYWVYKGALPNVKDKALFIGVKLGSPQASYMQQQGYENIVMHNDYTGLYKMLLAKRVQVVALPDRAYKGLVEQFGEGLTQHSPFLQRGYGFYLSPKSRPQLVKKVNQATVICRP